MRMVIQDGKLGDFIKLWRQHFLDTMKPRAMPINWGNNEDIYAEFGV